MKHENESDLFARVIGGISLIIAMLTLAYTVHTANQNNHQTSMALRVSLLQSMYELRTNYKTMEVRWNIFFDISKTRPKEKYLIPNGIKLDDKNKKMMILIEKKEEEHQKNLSAQINNIKLKIDRLNNEISKFSDFKLDYDIDDIDEERSIIDRKLAEVNRNIKTPIPKIKPITYYKNGQMIQWPPQYVEIMMETAR